MSTADAIREYICALPAGKLFTTRELLHLGKRSAIDQCLCRMVADQEIIRWAWGVFMRAEEENRVPSILEVATVKAHAFGKQIAQDGQDAAYALGLSAERNNTPTFVATNRSTSFLYAKMVRVRIKGTAQRKLLALDQFGESVVKAFWHLGKTVAEKMIKTFIERLSSFQIATLIDMRNQMPSWLSDLMVDLWETGWREKGADTC